MSVRIIRPLRPTSTTSLGARGELDVFVPAEVEAERADGSLDRPQGAIALRWREAPRGARLSQHLSLRAFLTTSSRHTVPLRPDPPWTDTTLYSSRPDGTRWVTRHPLSEPEGARAWDLDAAPTRAGRCPAGRAYVSDASYDFADRDGSTLVFYDAPTPSLADPTEAVRRGGDPTDVTGYELVALFFTAFWIETQWIETPRLGGVVWSCSWRSRLGLSSVTTSSSRRFDPPIPGDPRLAVFHDRPPVGPTSALCANGEPRDVVPVA